MFLFLPFPSLSSPLLSLFSLSLGDDTKWPIRVSLNHNTIINQYKHCIKAHWSQFSCLKYEFIGLDKSRYQVNIFFSDFFTKTYVVVIRTASQVLLISIHNICFFGEIRKQYFWIVEGVFCLSIMLNPLLGLIACEFKARLRKANLWSLNESKSVKSLKGSS